jgi:magnesium transporter
MDNPLAALVQKIEELLEKGDEAAIRRLLAEEHPGDIAEILGFVGDEEEKCRLFRLTPETERPEILSHVDDATLTVLLARLSDHEISRAIDELPTDDAADIVGRLPEEDASRVLALLEEEDQENLQKLLEYPEESAGGIMESEFVAVPEHVTVEEAVAALRKREAEVEQVHNVYLVDDAGRLTGILPLWRVAIAMPGTRLDRLAERDVVGVPAQMDQEEVAAVVMRYDLPEVPVVDDAGRLIGRITVDDVLDVVEEEATEDISLMAGTGDEEIHETSPFRISMIRLPWLLIGLCGGIGSAFLMSRFEGELRRILALAFFVPVITAMGGNVGMQCSSIVVRALALGEMEAYRIARRLAREFSIAILNGFILGGILSLVAYLWHGAWVLGVIVGLSMFASILVAATTGTLFPMVFRRLGLDPALATGPFVTTSNDVINLLIYFVVAEFLMRRF